MTIIEKILTRYNAYIDTKRKRIVVDSIMVSDFIYLKTAIKNLGYRIEIR